MTKMNLFFVALTLLIFNALVVNGQKNDDSSNESIKTEISVEKGCYSLREEINVTVIFNNEENVPIYLYRKAAQDFLQGLEILVYDSENKQIGEVNPKSVRNWNSPQTKDFVKLEPNSSLTEVITLRLSNRGAREKGEYSLRGYYRSPITQSRIPEFYSGEKVWTLQDGDIYSSKLKIIVMDNCGN